MGWDRPDRRDENLASIVPRHSNQAYNARRIVETVVDGSTFSRWENASSASDRSLPGLARLERRPVSDHGPVTQLFGGGAWTAAMAAKRSRGFIDLAETFHLPVVHLVRLPGFQVGLAAEQSGLVRKAYADRGARPDHGALVRASSSERLWCGRWRASAAWPPMLRYAWPSASWGSLPLGGGSRLLIARRSMPAPDKAAKLAEIQATLNALRSPFRTGSLLGRGNHRSPRCAPALCEFANIAAPCRKVG